VGLLLLKQMSNLGNETVVTSGYGTPTRNTSAG